MPRIRVLPADLANKIAAGEVVDRPASVVKELLENAIDADARTIVVTCEGGGRALISVEDDGEGMGRDDAVLAFERHATSKIREAADLFRIETLGFRGEALPSIASVSRLTLQTAPRGGGEGTRLLIDGGRIVTREPATCAPGTTVLVEDLFCNVPARRKFLRAPETELSHIVRIVESYAMASPSIRFSLSHGGRGILDLSPREDLVLRVSECLGRGALDGATRLDGDLGPATLRAVLPSLSLTRSTRNGQYIFVNGRLVRDRVISHALFAAYEDLVPKGRHPSLVVFLDMDPSRVDVNVHPTKAEVRLQDGRRLHETLARALRDAYRARGDVAPLPIAPSAVPTAFQPPLQGGATIGLGRPAVMPSIDPLAARSPIQWHRASPLCDASPQPDDLESYLPGPHEIPRIIGQFRRTFIVASDAAGMLLIDQHVAHERVLFEEAYLRLGRNDAPRQPLLHPELLQIGSERALLLREHLPSFAALGFSIEPFGDGGFAVRECPSFLAGRTGAELLSEVLDDLAQGLQSNRSVDAARHAIAASIACRAAVKAHRPMNPEEQAKLLADLWRCENRHQCPHGRPIMLRLSYEQVARHFGRH